MKIFITGGSGFLGQKVIQRLLVDGHSIGALVRSEASAKIVESIGAKAIQGDITRVESFADALNNFDVVVHCAAPVEFWGPWQKYQHGVIDSTIQLAKECCRHNVKRFIHISSESVLQDKSDLFEINEDYPYPLEPNSFYGKAKKITEQELLKIKDKMQIIILRPTFIWGPDCPAFSTIAQKVKSGQFVWVDQGKKNFEAVHVENVAEAIRLAISAGKDRKIYFVTDNEDSTARAFFENLFRALSLPIPTNSLPGTFLRPLAELTEYFWKFFRIKRNPPITRYDLAFVGMSRKYNINRIKTDLNYRPVISRSEGFKQLYAV